MHSNRAHFLQRVILAEARNPVWRRSSSWKLRRTQFDLQVADGPAARAAGPQPVTVRTMDENRGTRA